MPACFTIGALDAETNMSEAMIISQQLLGLL